MKIFHDLLVLLSLVPPLSPLLRPQREQNTQHLDEQLHPPMAEVALVPSPEPRRFENQMEAPLTLQTT